MIQFWSKKVEKFCKKSIRGIGFFPGGVLSGISRSWGVLAVFSSIRVKMQHFVFLGALRGVCCPRFWDFLNRRGVRAPPCPPNSTYALTGESCLTNITYSYPVKKRKMYIN